MMAVCDILALPSLAEGTPMVSLLADGTGAADRGERSVRSVRNHGAQEISAPDRAGRPRQLTKALDRLLTDPALGRRFGGAAKALMERVFSAEAAIRRSIAG